MDAVHADAHAYQGDGTAADGAARPHPHRRLLLSRVALLRRAPPSNRQVSIRTAAPRTPTPTVGAKREGQMRRMTREKFYVGIR